MELLAYVLLGYLVLSILGSIIGLIYWWPFYRDLRRNVVKRLNEDEDI